MRLADRISWAFFAFSFLYIVAEIVRSYGPWVPR